MCLVLGPHLRRRLAPALAAALIWCQLLPASARDPQHVGESLAFYWPAMSRPAPDGRESEGDQQAEAASSWVRRLRMRGGGGEHAPSSAGVSPDGLRHSNVQLASRLRIGPFSFASTSSARAAGGDSEGDGGQMPSSSSSPRLSSSSPAASGEVPPHKLPVVFAQLVFRHGARTPLTDKYGALDTVWDVCQVREGLGKEPVPL